MKIGSIRRTKLSMIGCSADHLSMGYSINMSESVFNNAMDMSDIDRSEWLKYIGLGYRSVCYTTDFDRNGRIILFGFDPEGNRKTFICPHKSHVKYQVAYKTAEQDTYDNYVETKWFQNKNARNKWVDGYKGRPIVESLKPEQEFLQELFYDKCLEANFNKQELRGHFIDIETEISERFMPPSEAANRINMITIYDTLTKKFYTWSLEHADVEFHDFVSTIKPKRIEAEFIKNRKHNDVRFFYGDTNEDIALESDTKALKAQIKRLMNSGRPIKKFVHNHLKDYPQSKFEFFEFNNNESWMLEHFISWIEDNYPDYSSGWNIKAYDWPYIIRRIENVLGKEAAKRISPIGWYRIKDINHENARSDVSADIEVDIPGLFIADDLVLYRNKFNIAGSLDGGHNLSNVGEHEGLGRKVEYDGTLKDLYTKDYQMFYEYNVRDVDLVVRIEEKCKLIPLARRVVGSGLCDYNTIYSSISYLIGSLISFSKVNMGRIFKSYLPYGANESKSYEGAFVFPPVVGVYRGGIAGVDVNSLYPSTIRSLNLSPETYVGKIGIGGITDSDEPIDLTTTAATVFKFRSAKTGNISDITKEQLLQLIDTKCIFTRNNTLFYKHEVKQGVVSAWCAHFYGARKTTQKAMQKLEMDLYNHTIAEDKIDETETEVQNLNSAQMAYKIMINSIYGILGTAHSPICNIDLAQTITRNGKFFNITASKYAFSRFKEEFNIPDDYVIVTTGDTDSVEKRSSIIIQQNGVESVAIEDLYNKLLHSGTNITYRPNGYELLDVSNIEIKTIGNRFVKLKYLCRHKTAKHLLKLIIKTAVGRNTVIVTTDHVCMVYNRDHFFENLSACELDIGQTVSVYNQQSDQELVGTIIGIDDLGETAEYVYDAEVDDGNHCFYANNVLVHNSQFMNIQCVTDWFKSKYNLDPTLRNWPDEFKLKLWRWVDNFVEKDLNIHMQQVIADYCHTKHADVLRYSLEYVGDVGIYEAKKHYAVHKIVSEGPELVDKIKFVGVELKKATSPLKVKEFLGDVYDGVLLYNWQDTDYSNYINDLYEDFKRLGIDDIAMWKGYNTASESTGQFLQMVKGATGIGKACTYYNQIIEKLGIAKKYDQITVGQKVRFTYICDNNPYGINRIAFPDGQWPDEFNDLFRIDYDVMFDKLITSPLKGLLKATGFNAIDPKKQVVEDIFDL